MDGTDGANGPILRRYDTLVKMMFLGDSGVGKTCLMCTYAGQPVSDSHISTIGIDFKMHTLEIDSHVARVQMWDTAGQERFHTLCTQYYRRAEGVMLVFDLTSEESFRNIRMWLQSVEENAPQNVCQVLIGNKCDLVAQRKVARADAESLAEEFGLEYVETSARQSLNTNGAMTILCRLILGKKGVFNDQLLDGQSPQNIQLTQAERKDAGDSSSCYC